ncbi:hypothetical protein FJ958_21425 [Mesorhizobium sp. B2-3-5]|nr:hypothetical protein FJ958_21425 [Mesorhizobium sp. B2-3-5]
MSPPSSFPKRCAAPHLPDGIFSSYSDGERGAVIDGFANYQYRRRLPACFGDQRGARLARIRCSVRRCMLSRRAVSETLRSHIS